MRVEILASSSAANATLLEVDGDRILLDAGLPRKTLQRALDYRASALSAALVTHEHGDHARAAVDLAALGVDIASTPGTLKALQVPRHRTIWLEPGRTRSIGRWRVVAFAVKHDAEQPVGFLVGHTSSDARVLYLTDAGRVPVRFGRVTHALVEANYSPALLAQARARGATPAALAERIRETHLSIDQAASLLRELAEHPDLEEVHLLHLSDGHADAAAFAAQARAAAGVPVYIAGAQGSHRPEEARP